jgi:hypothetical protein
MSRTARSGSTTTAPRRSSPGGWAPEAGASARVVSDHPQLWVAGGLSWAATAAPLALLLAIVPLPGPSDLVFIASRAVTSSLWPWNVVAVGALAMALGLLALGLVALGEAGLRSDRRAMRAATVLRAVTVTVAAVLPTVAVAALAGVAMAGVARDEFVAPEAAFGPVVGTAARVAPLLVLLGLVVVSSGAFAAAARVAVLDHGAGARAALASAPRLLAGGGAAAAIHVIVSVVARLAYLVVATLLLAVLWAPIGAQLASGADFDAPLGMLLVGFVAIWLCLVLGGGALHAWGSMTWTRLLAAAPRTAELGRPDTKETPSIP